MTKKMCSANLQRLYYNYMFIRSNINGLDSKYLYYVIV